MYLFFAAEAGMCNVSKATESLTLLVTRMTSPPFGQAPLLLASSKLRAGAPGATRDQIKSRSRS